MRPRGIDSLPASFEQLIWTDPAAPAVVLRRRDGRDRIWTRAAVEHRAVRIGALCAALGLAADARVAIAGHGALDVLASAWYVLATGRLLCEPAEAQFTLDDAVLARAVGLHEHYALRCAVMALHPAARLGGATFTQQGLLHAVVREDVRLERGLLARCLHALATGEPVVVEATGLPNARDAVCAA
jgi:hypothetical protein